VIGSEKRVELVFYREGACNFVNELVLGTFHMENLSHFSDCISFNWHVLVHLHAQAGPLDRLLHNLECQERYLLVRRIQNCLRHLLDHLLVALLVLIRHSFRVHDVIDSFRQSIVDLLNVFTHLRELCGKGLLRIRHVQERLRCRVDEVVLLSDREDIPLQAKLFELFGTYAFCGHSKFILLVWMKLGILFEYLPGFRLLSMNVAMVLAAKNFVESFNLS